MLCKLLMIHCEIYVVKYMSILNGVLFFILQWIQSFKKLLLNHMEQIQLNKYYMYKLYSAGMQK